MNFTRSLQNRLQMAKVRGNVTISARRLGVEAPKVARQKVFIMHCHFYRFQVGLFRWSKGIKMELIQALEGLISARLACTSILFPFNFEV